MQRALVGRIYHDRFWATARKHVPAATNRRAPIEVLLRGLCREVMRKTIRATKFSYVRESVNA
jgi:hypothetical protein